MANITTWAELAGMTLDGDHVLMNDLGPSSAGYDTYASSSANEGAGWAPIGSSSPFFTGSFDGQGYTISGLYINRPATRHVGLFSWPDGATIRNVTLADVSVTGLSETGGLAGEADECTIEDCYVSGNVEGGDYVGGLIGDAWRGTINRCGSSAVVTGDDYDTGGLIGLARSVVHIADSWATGEVTSTNYRRTGGFVGYLWGDGASITRCWATGDVIGESHVGGFAGVLSGGTVTECYSTGNAEGTSTTWNGYVGGFVGIAGDNLLVERSYSTGNATAPDITWAAGGFAGELYGSGASAVDCYARGNVNAPSADAVGGFVGTVNDATVTNCLSTGHVVGGASDVGGLVGENDGGTVTNSFWDTETSGMAASDSGTGKTTAEMKDIASFTEWNIAGTTTDLNNGYPFLSWQLGNSPTWLIPEELILPAATDRDIVALQALRNIEMSAMGRIYVDEEGNLCYENRYSRQA